MSKLLFINACIREDSKTKILADAILEKWDGEVIEVPLGDGKVKPLTTESLKKRMKLRETQDYSDDIFALARQFKEADTVLIAAPYWDFSIPAALKAYIENICIEGLTFELKEDGSYRTLCDIDRLVIVTTIGGVKQEITYGIEYIKAVFRSFFNVKKINSYKAEGLDLVNDEAKIQKILADTLSEIDKFSFTTGLANDQRKDIIRTTDLTKMYGNFYANNNVSMHIKEGSIYGLIGRNGAGKSTAMKMLLGITPPTSGEMEMLDKKNSQLSTIRKDIGFIIESPTFYDYLNAYQNLRYRAELIGLKNPDAAIKEAARKVGIEDRLYQKVKGFSLGQRQLLGIANAILGNPKLLILDEPTNGLDPIKIVEIRKMLLDMNAQGTTILISSHILGEMGKLCSCYGFILDGKLIREVTEEEMETESIDVEELFVEMAMGGQDA